MTVAAAEERQMADLGHELRLKAIREDAREADFVASTGRVDRYDEVIDQSTWILDDYKANPVVLYMHDRYDLPVGQSTRCEVIGGQLETTIRFASAAANPKAENVWQSIKERTLRAVSVGFRARDVRMEMRDGKDIYVLSNCELREISVCAIPANPDALAKMKAKALAAAGQQPPHARAEENPMAMTAEEQKAYNEAIAKAASADSAISTAKAEASVAQKSLETERSERAVIESQNKKLVAERDAAIQRAEVAEKATAEGEVKALVNKKINANEVESFTKLRLTNKALFDEMIAQRSDMRLEGRVVTDQKSEDRTRAGDAQVVDAFEYHAAQP